MSDGEKPNKVIIPCKKGEWLFSVETVMEKVSLIPALLKALEDLGISPAPVRTYQPRQGGGGAGGGNIQKAPDEGEFKITHIALKSYEPEGKKMVMYLFFSDSYEAPVGKAVFKTVAQRSEYEAFLIVYSGLNLGSATVHPQNAFVTKAMAIPVESSFWGKWVKNEDGKFNVTFAKGT